MASGSQGEAFSGFPDPPASGWGGETRESPVGQADLPARGRDQEGDCGVGSGRTKTGGKHQT